MVISKGITTDHSNISMNISNDSKVAIAIMKSQEYEYDIEMYSLTTYEKVFEEKVGGEE